jgi:hypothetical protein
MRAPLSLALFLLLASSLAFGDLTKYGKPNGETEIKPQAIPTSLTTVVTGDVHLTNLVIMVVSGSPTVTVQDLQGTPVPLLPGVTTVNGTTYFLPPGVLYYCPGGFAITSSGAGAYFYASWK